MRQKNGKNEMTLMGEGALHHAETAFTMAPESSHRETLHECVSKAVKQYLADMGGHDPDDLYRLVLSQVEKPLIAEVLQWAGGNQCRTALALGISRGTLRKKMQLQNID